MAAAERNDLLKNIDRWVVGAALSFAAQRRPQCLSCGSRRRPRGMPPSSNGWTITSARHAPSRSGLLPGNRGSGGELPAGARPSRRAAATGIPVRARSFGSGRDSPGLLESVPLDFVKIDGALVQGLARDPQLQQRVRGLVESATKRSIQTIAERVEDANTMAVLWQLGVQYIQGYFVNAPEEVVMG